METSQRPETTPTPGTTGPTAGTASRRLAWAVLAAAVLEVVAPVITSLGPGASPGGGSGPDLLITPAGWAFSIWSVIYTLAIVQAVVQLVRPADLPLRLQVDQLVLYLGGTLWVGMAALDDSVATAAALLLMFVAAVDGVLTATRSHLGPRAFTILTRAAIGLYAGWVTAAFFLNVSTALVDLGAFGAEDLGWQLVILVLAVATLLAMTAAARGVLTYALAGCWALVGIAATGSSDGTTEVLVAALVSLVVLAVATAALRISGRHPRAT